MMKVRAPPHRHLNLIFVFVCAFVLVSVLVIGEGGVGCCSDCQSKGVKDREKTVYCNRVTS